MKNILKIALIAKPYRLWLLIASILILLSALLQQVTPLLVKEIVDLIEDSLSNQTAALKQLYFLLTITFFTNIVGVVLTAVSNRLGDAISGRISMYLVSLFYDRIMRLPQSYFDSTLSGKILNQLTRGILAIGEFIGAATNFILPSIIQVVLTIGILSYYSVPIGILSLLIFPIYIWISNYSTIKWGIYEQEKNTLEDSYKNRIAEVIQNMKLVKTANTQLMEIKEASRVGKKYVSIYDKQSSMYHWLNFLRNGVLEIILIVVTFMTFQATFSKTFSLGVMVLMIQLLNQLRRPLFAMSFILERIQKAEAGAKEFFEIISLPQTESIERDNYIDLIKQPVIQLNKVDFTYDKNQILSNISLTIGAGETVALIGPSGAGKTTLVNLMLKLYEPSKGKLSFSNKEYETMSHAYIRSHFSYVFQDNELFSSTVYENVAYGHNVPLDKINKALKAAYADEFVMELPEGINTKIGERGVKLSGGQKQRLQIARAIVSPSPILILDEATSSLDAKSEAIIQEALLNLTKEKTVIIIAHRFSTLQHVDRIVVIDKGKVVDQGSPKDLANREGVFKELLKYQIEGNQKLLAKYDLIS